MNAIEEIGFWDRRREYYSDRMIAHWDNPVAVAIYRARLDEIDKTVDALMERHVAEEAERKYVWLRRLWRTLAGVARV